MRQWSRCARRRPGPRAAGSWWHRGRCCSCSRCARRRAEGFGIEPAGAFRRYDPHIQGEIGSVVISGTNDACRGVDSRITRWAGEAGFISSKVDFSAVLDGPQIERELVEIVRETPEYGRSLATRLADFIDETSSGSLHLVGGGGEAIVLFEDEDQRVIKLSGRDTPAEFGWVIDESEAEPGLLILRAGGLAEALIRFALFEDIFRSGLEIERVGEGGAFLLMRQPFIAGEHPAVEALHKEMLERGWEPCEPNAIGATLAELSWRRDDILATDVRPENAILADADGRIYPIDFVVGLVSEFS